MITYLHHTTPDLPHYRGKEWNFQRGAAATVDRPFLGWQGRFFLHDVAHFHVVHHVRALPFSTSLFHSLDSSSPIEFLDLFVCTLFNFKSSVDVA